jgi:hypothetical protein
LDGNERTAREVQPVIDEMEALRAQLVTSDDGSYPPPMLIDQLGYLYGMTSRADQQLGQDAFARLETLRTELDGLLDEWSSMLQRHQMLSEASE